MANEGKYLYAIIREHRPREFGSIGIGDRNDEVYTVRHKDLSCIVSNSPLRKYPVNRENCMAHQKVLEKAMEEYTILPVRYGVIAEDLDIVSENLLKENYEMLTEQLDRIKGKAELGLKVIWKEMPAIYQELVSENEELRTFRDAIRETATQDQRMKLGKMVEAALQAKKESEQKMILTSLKEISTDSKDNYLMGEWMVINSVFLVDKSKMEEFDRKVNQLAKQHDDRTKFKYFGPVPPYNFVNVPVHLLEHKT